MAAAYAQVPPTTRSPTVRWLVGCSSSTPSIVIDGSPHTADLGAHLAQHRGQIDDLGLPGGVVDHRRAVGQHRGHQDVLGRADAREVQPDRRPVQLVRLGRPPCRARCSSSRPSRAARTGACPAVATRSRRRPAAPPRPGDSGPSADPSTHTEARSRPTAGKSAWNDSSAGVVIVTVSPSRVTVQPSPRSTSAISGTSRISGQLEIDGGALGQQRGRHQLQHAVLGAGDLDGAGEPGPAGDQEAFHGWHSNRPDPPDHRPLTFRPIRPARP